MGSIKETASLRNLCVFARKKCNWNSRNEFSSYKGNYIARYEPDPRRNFV